MRRLFVLVFVMLGMVCQATAVAGPMALVHGEGALEHAMLHWQDEGHHHHDDGSYHQDDSDASVKHLALDAAMGAAALWSAPVLTVEAMGTDTPTLHESTAPPAPVLERLRRPPKLAL